MTNLSTLVAEFLREHLLLRAAAAVASGAFFWLVLRSFKTLAHRRLLRRAPLTQGQVDDLLAELVGRTGQVFLVALALLPVLSIVDLPPAVERIGRGLVVVACLVQAGIWGTHTIRELAERRLAASGGDAEDPGRKTVGRMLGLAARATLWVLLFLLALSNFGVNITALVAGLGVGGVAVALAVQNVLGDVFASVAILLDKPFVPGDFVVVGDFMGTVEHLGLKTTRLRSLGGEELVFSNHDLIQSRLRNYKRMSERRISFRLGVVYETPLKKLEALPGLLRQIVEQQEEVRFDRAHFAAYGDFALTFEIVYYVLSPDYGRYMDIQQAINFSIFRRLAEQKIEFAYPTQTLLVRGPDRSAPLPGGG